MNNQTAIRISDLRKSYGNHAVLRGLDFSIEKGEIFALLGVNGAGKTTALECMEDLRRFDHGSIVINGRIGIQLQNSALPGHIMPMEVLKLSASCHKTSISPDLVDSLGIRAFEKTQYARLSTGQKRRLMLALALVHDPDILFLDEPTAGLDVEGRSLLHWQIRRLKSRGKTIILASHDMAEVEALCDRIAILHQGTIAFCGTPSALTEETDAQYAIRLTTKQGTIRHTTNNITDTLLALLTDSRKKNIPVLDIQVDRGTLEEHFLKFARRTEQ